MTDFALVLQGVVILPDRIVANGYVAVADGKDRRSRARPCAFRV